MTEKRFTIADYPTDIVDNQTGEKYACSSYSTHMEIICDLLNELFDENEQLKSRINNYDVALKTLQDLTDKKLKENEQLNVSRDELIHENRHIKNTIQTMLINERTRLGKSVLKQLWEAIQ